MWRERGAMADREPGPGREHPFGSFAADLRRLSGSRLELGILAPATILNLRVDPAQPDFASAARAVFGIELPEANRWAQGTGCELLWLGPDEWLVLAEDGRAAELEAAIRRSPLSGPWLSVVDLSHGYARLLLTGPAARETLAKGCALDLDPGAFGAKACVQTLVARVRALLRLTNREAPAIELWVRNSYARHIAVWLMAVIDGEGAGGVAPAASGVALEVPQREEASR
jgi:sarcosine oxidase, subunit gamma